MGITDSNVKNIMFWYKILQVTQLGLKLIFDSHSSSMSKSDRQFTLKFDSPKIK